MIDPILLFKENWQQAKDAGDESAKYCTVATAQSKDNVATRTLVLREVTDNSFIIYVNRTSAKWAALSAGIGVEMLVFWPSLMQQYRIRGVCSELSEQDMATHWARKPYESKLLDHYYQQRRQSSAVDSRLTLIGELAILRERFPSSAEIPFVDNATGIAIKANYIEAWQSSSEDNIHRRALFTLTREGWAEQVLVP